ncbi:MAG TPA: hypothetical protein VN948_21175 [Terriglobales bacterium]|nr:hypothetical protein [Terriglobales bacterium]
MTRYTKLVVCVIATLCTEVAFAQVASTQIGASIQAPASRSRVAFVYVSSSPSEINAFAAASNGKLTPVSGSPFSADVQDMAVNGKYLFGTNGIYIYSFSIASDGALKQVASINAQQFNGYNCGGPIALFLDHAGATLYDLDYDGNVCANNAYQFLDIDRSTGGLSYLGVTGDSSVQFEAPLSFTGNNVYAYGSGCYHMEALIFGFKRNSDQTLTDLNINPAMPVAKKGDFYCPSLPTADPTNHLAISFQAYNGQSWQPDGPPQLATYTADSSGNLTTKSTFWKMPKTALKYATDISMSPSGRLLAVAGMPGLQVFHFNGSHPITYYTGLLTKDQVDQSFWDNDNHLYAISRSAGKLFVFTITPTSVRQAPGSPYTITNPQNIIVLPKT